MLYMRFTYSSDQSNERGIIIPSCTNEKLRLKEVK